MNPGNHWRQWTPHILCVLPIVKCTFVSKSLKLFADQEIYCTYLQSQSPLLELWYKSMLLFQSLWWLLLIKMVPEISIRTWTPKMVSVPPVRKLKSIGGISFYNLNMKNTQKIQFHLFKRHEKIKWKSLQSMGSYPVFLFQYSSFFITLNKVIYKDKDCNGFQGVKKDVFPQGWN